MYKAPERKCPSWFTRLLDMALTGDEQQRGWAKRELLRSVAELHHKASTRNCEAEYVCEFVAHMLHGLNPAFSQHSTPNTIKNEIWCIINGYGASGTRELLKKRLTKQDGTSETATPSVANV